VPRNCRSRALRRAHPLAGAGCAPRAGRAAALLRCALILLSLSSASCSFTCLGLPANDPSLCAALASIYAGFNSPSSLANWSSAAAGIATDYCTFTGLTCNTSLTPYIPTQLCARLRRAGARPRAPHRPPAAARCTTRTSAAPFRPPWAI